MQLLSRTAWRAMPAALLALLGNTTAFAALPTITLPPGAQAGDPISIWQGYARLGINVAVLVLGAWAFWMVAAGALNKWKLYQQGRAELTEMKEYFIYGALVLAVIVGLLTIANTII